MRPAHVQAFIDKVLGYAQAGAAATGLPLSVIIAQWGGESGWGRNRMAQRNNLASITAPGGRRYKSYPDLEIFTQDWIRVLNLDFYADVRAAAASGADAETVARLLGESPYSASKYSGGRTGRPGSFLIDLIRDFDLTDLDVRETPPHPVSP